MQKTHAAVKLHTNDAIPIESRALGNIAYIRASIDSSNSMPVPGMAGIVMGVIGTAAALVTSVPQIAPYWLPIWLVAAASALSVGGAMMARETAQRGHARYLGPVRKFLFCLCPALLAGAVLTAVLWRAGVEELIPGMWLLLYGCAVLSASTVTLPNTRRLLCIMGTLFSLTGLGAFITPSGWKTLILGLGFGVLHGAFGVLIGRLNRGE